MQHVLMTPPGEIDNLSTLGVLQVCNTPQWAVNIYQGMIAEGWAITIVVEAEFEIPEGHYARELGMWYIGCWLAEHPEMDPLTARWN